MTSTPAPSSAETTARTWPSVNWCRIAWEPSRSVESVIRTIVRHAVASLTGVVAMTAAGPRRLIPATVRAESGSPTWAAAAVMMSRLPAHAGR